MRSTAILVLTVLREFPSETLFRVSRARFSVFVRHGGGGAAEISQRPK